MITRKNLLRALLVFVPVSAYLGMSHASPTWVFVAPQLLAIYTIFAMAFYFA